MPKSKLSKKNTISNSEETEEIEEYHDLDEEEQQESEEESTETSTSKRKLIDDIIKTETMETLLTIDGVGPNTAEKLIENDFATLERIAVSSSTDLSTLTGIGEPTCKKIIKSARDKLNIGFESAAILYERRKTKTRFTTGCQSLDNIILGGIETQSIYEFFGEFRTGKTQIAHQLCVTVQLPPENGGFGAGAIYIDAEGTFRPERIIEIANSNRFSKFLPDDKMELLDNIFHASAYNSDHQLLLIETIPKIIGGRNIKLVVVDSLISHLRAEYIGRGTLSDKQQRLNKQIHKLKELAQAYDFAIMITNQVQGNPAPFGVSVLPTGGHIMAHASHYRFYLRKGQKELRVARLIDSPCLPEAEAPYKITSEGIVDPKK